MKVTVSEQVHDHRSASVAPPTQRRSSWLRSALLPVRAAVWLARGELKGRLRQAREYRMLASSGLFDAAYYLRQIPEVDQRITADPLRHFLTVGGSEGKNPNPIFDSRWYLEQNPDIADAGLNPLSHYVRAGWQEGRNPHPLFEVRRYLESNPDVIANGNEPLAHYLRTGHAEDRNPNPLFANAWYLERHPEVSDQQRNPLAHYLEYGWKAGYDPHPLFDSAFYCARHPELRNKELNPLIHFSTEAVRGPLSPHPLFDSEYYLQLYPDVASSHGNPFVHFLAGGAAELRVPHVLFDPAFYLSNRGVPKEAALNPLVHYLEFGVRQHLSPHPLFDAGFYLHQDTSLARANRDPLQHYLHEGAQLGMDPCELFDSSYYLDRYGDVLRPDENPLVHFALQGWKSGCNPNPLFDTKFYLKQYPDVRRCGHNPLLHYVETGAAEGRAPSPFFDSLYYLRKNPELRAEKINPLAHYLVRGGAAEGKDPSPFFNTAKYLKEHPELKAKGLNPLAHYLGFDLEARELKQEMLTVPPAPECPVIRVRALELSAGHPRKKRVSTFSKTVLLVSHVSPIPARAGNEYRVNRLLCSLAAAGYRAIPVLSPLPPDEVSDEHLNEIAQRFGAAILCQRDGHITICGDGIADIVKQLDNSSHTSFAKALHENAPMSDRALRLLTADRTFCHEALVQTLSTLSRSVGRCVVIAEYIFMSRFLPLLGPNTLKIIDTIDVFSSKREKVLSRGVSDELSVTEAEESERLMRADIVVAIQSEEQRLLEKLSGDAKVITVGVDFETQTGSEQPHPHQLLYVASDNASNVSGLREFLRFAWPRVLSVVPDAELIVAGKVSRTVRSRPPHVRLVGPVEDLKPLYASAKVTINPAVAGTGLKIKTLEALSHFRPLVTWPTGTEGIAPELAAMCAIGTDWLEFSDALIQILSDPKAKWFSPNQEARIRENLAAEHVYAPLHDELRAFFQKAQVANA